MEDLVLKYVAVPIAWILGLFVLCLILALVACGVHEITCDKETKTIVEMGGCNRYECGVKYSDGTFGNESSPIVGQSVSRCKK